GKQNSSVPRMDALHAPLDDHSQGDRTSHVPRVLRSDYRYPPSRGRTLPDGGGRHSPLAISHRSPNQRSRAEEEERRHDPC
ncbi:hypothetical protein COCCADRAFT_112863, partial [Bipolaris zeicola 26-R-13]